MKKTIFLLLAACVLCMSCSKKKEAKNTKTNLQQGDSVEINASNETVIISNDAKSITINGNNNSVSTENSLNNTNK